MGKDCSCCGEMTVGPYGMESAGDNEWSYRPKQGFKQIIITYDTSYTGIHSIMFKGVCDGDYSNQIKQTMKTLNLTVEKIDIDFPSEFLTGISGTWSTAPHVCQLEFHTNKNRYGPFGSQKRAIPFSINANGGVITGFHGYYGSSSYLSAIGVYVVPPCSLSTEFDTEGQSEICFSSSSLPRFLPPPRSATAMGGNGGREWDDGVFSSVRGAHLRVRIYTGVLSAVQFSYTKNNGSDFLSPFHGGDCGGDMHKKTILFSEKGEYLMGIEGFYGAVEGNGGLNNVVIKSLSFITNKAKYGPVGAEIGTYFTSMNFGDCHRKVVGFHGRSGAYLDCIGLHTEYL